MELLPEIIIAPEERRDALRQPAGEWRFAIDHPQFGRHDGMILDVSRSGIRFSSGTCFPCGAIVTLFAPAETGLCTCTAKLVRVRMLDFADDNGGFEYGARFLDPVGTKRHTWYLQLRRKGY
jgi:hypothetical protein